MTKFQTMVTIGCQIQSPSNYITELIYDSVGRCDASAPIRRVLARINGP